MGHLVYPKFESLPKYGQPCPMQWPGRLGMTTTKRSPPSPTLILRLELKNSFKSCRSCKTEIKKSSELDYCLKWAKYSNEKLKKKFCQMFQKPTILRFLNAIFQKILPFVSLKQRFFSIFCINLYCLPSWLKMGDFKNNYSFYSFTNIYSSKFFFQL